MDQTIYPKVEISLHRETDSQTQQTTMYSEPKRMKSSRSYWKGAFYPTYDDFELDAIPVMVPSPSFRGSRQRQVRKIDEYFPQ